MLLGGIAFLPLTRSLELARPSRVKISGREQATTEVNKTVAAEITLAKPASLNDWDKIVGEQLRRDAMFQEQSSASKELDSQTDHVQRSGHTSKRAISLRGDA